MAYASTTHVEALNDGRSSKGGWPAASVMSEWLEQTAGVLDGLLAESGYSVPVSPTAATSALRTLEGFNAAGAWYQVELAAKTRDKVQFEAAKSMWDSAQKMLADGIMRLDLETDSTELFPRGGFGAESSAPTPYFTRDMVL